MNFVKSKRILSLLLAFMLTAGSIAAVAEEQTPEMPQQVDKLVFLGIVESKDAQKMPDSEVNRAELALMAIRLHGFEDIVDKNYTTHYFHDVSADYIESGYINAAAELGIMQGVREGYFEPRKAVSGKEVVETIVKVLGYEPYVKVRGGGYTQYYAVASKLKLIKDVTISDKPISRADVYRLFLNSLDAEVLTANGMKNDSVDFTAKEGKTVLTEYHNIYTTEGIVTSTKYGNLVNATTKISDNRIIVNNSTFECEIETSGYLGYNVKLYYKDDGAKKALYVEKADNETLVLTRDDIVSCNNLVYEYAKGSERIKTINAQGMHILYNGNAISNGITDFIPRAGDVTFIDNDNDSSYDVVSIRSYTNRLLVSVDNARQVIYTKTGNPISIENAENINVRRENGEKIALSDLKANNVIAIACDSKGEVIEIVLCGGDIYGRVSYTKEGVETEYVIEGEEYISSDALNMAINAGLTGAIGIGTSGTFIYGYGNEIVWWEPTVLKMDGTEWEFGLLKGAKVDEMGSSMRVSVFTKTNNFEVMETGSSLEIDGTVYKDLTAAFAALCKNGEFGTPGSTVVQQLIRFRCKSDGKLAKIDLAGTESNHGDGVYLSEIAGNTADGVVSSGVQYIKSGLQFYGKRTEADAVGGGGIGVIDEKTEIFVCPITNHVMNLSDIKTLRHDLAKDFLEPIGSTKRNENVYCYKVEDDQIANSVLCYSADVKTVLDSYAAINIFISSQTVLDAEGNKKEQITYLVDDTGEKTLYLAEGVSSKNISLKNNDADTNTATYTLESGDLFQFTLDAVGDINSLKPRYDCKNHAVVGTNYDDNSVVTASYRTAEAGYIDIGYAYAKKNGVVKGVYDKNVSADVVSNTFSNYITRKNFKFYIYDVESEKLTVGDFNNIMDYSSTNGECDRIIIRHRNWDPQQVFIYKGEKTR